MPMLKPAKTVAAATPSSPAKETELVTTATLIRGRIYFYKDIPEPFEKGIPKVVSDEIGDALEELHEEITDGDSEVFEKPYFHVRRDQPKPGKVTTDHNKRPARRLPIIPLNR